MGGSSRTPQRRLNVVRLPPPGRTPARAGSGSSTDSRSPSRFIWYCSHMDESELCDAKNCDRPKELQGFCRPHYGRHKRGADMDAPLRSVKRHSLNGEWSEWRLLKSGYVKRDRWIKAEKRQEVQLQHHFVWEQHYGPVPKGFTVHHKNTNRSDNRIENLELWVGGQPKGGRVEEVLPWAQSVLEACGYKVVPPVD